MSGRGGRRGAAAAALAVLAVSGCVGPARDTGTYADKAMRSAQDALSQVQTARMAVDADRRGSILQPYLQVVLADAEEAISAIQDTFDSIQPPDSAEADALRDDLDAILADGVAGVAQLRIASRRGDGQRLASVSEQLADVADDLQAFEQGRS